MKSLLDKAEEAILNTTPLDSIPEIKKVNNLKELKKGIPLIHIKKYNSIIRLELIDPKKITRNPRGGKCIEGDFYLQKEYNPITKTAILKKQEYHEIIVEKEKIDFKNDYMQEEWFKYDPD